MRKKVPCVQQIDRKGAYICVAIEVVFLAVSLGCNGLLAGDRGAQTSVAVRVNLVPKRTTIPGGRVEIPCQVLANIPIVQATVNGSGPYSFVVDVGTTGVVIDKDLAGRLGLPRLRTKATFATASGVSDVPMGRVSMLTLGKCEFHDVDVAVHDLSQVGRTYSGKVDGFLGIRLFGACRLTIDYPAEKVVLERFDFGSPLVVNAQDTFECRQRSDGLIFVPVEMDSCNLWLCLDSGSIREIYGPTGLASCISFESAPVSMPWRMKSLYHAGTVEAHGARAQTALILGRYRVPSPVVLLKSTQAPRPAFMGGGILKHFTLTVDQRSRLIRFGRDAPDPVRRSAPLRHCGFYCAAEREGLRITSPIRGVSLNAMGLASGDLVTAVNDKRLAEMEPWEWRQVVQESNTLTMTVQRGQDSFQVKVPAIVLVP